MTTEELQLTEATVTVAASEVLDGTVPYTMGTHLRETRGKVGYAIRESDADSIALKIDDVEFSGFVLSTITEHGWTTVVYLEVFYVGDSADEYDEGYVRLSRELTPNEFNGNYQAGEYTIGQRWLSCSRNLTGAQLRSIFGDS